MNNDKVRMTLEGKEITWQKVENTVAKRMVDLSLVHKLVAKRILRKRTKMLNCMMEKMPVRSYSQYVKIKTSALRNIPDDTDIDDNEKFTDEDYMQVYNSEESMRNYLLETSKTNVDLTIDSDDDYIFLSQSNTSGNQDVSLGWHRVIKKKVRVIEQPKESLLKKSTVKTKKNITKTIDKRKKPVSVQSSIKKLFKAKKICNNDDALVNGDNTETDNNVSDTNESLDDTPLNERHTIVPITKSPEPRITDNDETTESPIKKSPKNTEPQDDTANSDTSKAIIKDKSLPEKESNKPTMEKDSSRKRKKSVSQEEEFILSIKKKGKNSAVKETVDDTKENVMGNIPKVNAKEAVVTVKKNLLGAFDNFSIISGHQVPELGESIVNESTDMNGTNLRMSNINPLCGSTPVHQYERTGSRFLQPVSEKQKDSGIDEDSQEESSETGKVEAKQVVIVPTDGNEDNRISESSSNNSDLSNEPAMVIDEDASSNDTSDSDKSEDTLILSNSNAVKEEEDLETTFILNNSNSNVEEEQHKERPQPKITCSKILSQKFVIITAKPQEETKVSEPPVEEKCEDPQVNKDDDSMSKISVDDEHEDHQSQVLSTEKENIEADSDNADEMMSITSTKRVQQLKRLNLTADSSSSEDEDYTLCQTQKPRQILVTNHDTDEDSDDDDASCVADSQNLKKADEPKSSPKKKGKRSLQDDCNLANIGIVPDTQDLQKLSEPRTSTPTKQKQKSLQVQPHGLNNNVENAPGLVQGGKHSKSTAKGVEDSFSFSESEEECLLSLAEDFPLAQKMNESILEPTPLHQVNKQPEEERSTRIEVLLGDGQTQTDVHIPPRAILKRPNDLQDYLGQETLVENKLVTSFSIQDFADDDIYIMTVPKKLLNSELIGQKVVLSKNKLKLGKRKYKALHKDVESMTCVLGSGDNDKPYKTVNVKPVGVVVTQARLKKVTRPSTSRNLQGGKFCKIKLLNKKINKERLVKDPKKKLDQIQSSKVSQKKVKKRKMIIVSTDEGGSS